MLQKKGFCFFFEFSFSFFVFLSTSCSSTSSTISTTVPRSRGRLGRDRQLPPQRRHLRRGGGPHHGRVDDRGDGTRDEGLGERHVLFFFFFRQSGFFFE